MNRATAALSDLAMQPTLWQQPPPADLRSAPSAPEYAPPPRTGAINERFWRYHADNPEVYDLLVRYARQAKAAGHPTYSIKGLFERVRWNRTVETKTDDGWKLNNNYSARYARLLMANEPDLRDFFHTRELRSA